MLGRPGRQSTTVLITVGLVAVLALFSGRMQNLEYMTQDWRFRLRGEREPAPEIVIVAVDEASLLQEGPWPWGLAKLTRLVDGLHAAGARVIALDCEAVVAATRETAVDRQELEAFRRSVAGAGNVVLPGIMVPAGEAAWPADFLRALQKFSAGPGDTRLPVSLEHGTMDAPALALVRATAGLGVLNVFPETDRVLRKLPLFVRWGELLYPSLAAESARVYLGLRPGTNGYPRYRSMVQLDGHRVFTDEAGEFLVNYAGGYETYPQVSAAAVLGGPTPEAQGQLRDRLVVVGLTAGSLAGAFPTPLAPLLPAPEVQANGMASLLQGTALRELPLWTGWVLALVASLGLVGWVGAGRAGRAMVGTVGALAMYFAASWGLFAGGVVLPTAVPLLALLLTGSALVMTRAREAEIDQAQGEAHAEARVRTLMSVGQLLVTGLDRERLLRDILRWVQRELEVEAVSLLLMDERHHVLRFEASLGGAEEEILDFALELGQGIAGTVAMTGEPLIVNDASHDPRQAQDIAAAVEVPARSIVCVPMVRQGRVVGVLEALNRRSREPFTQADADLLSVIAQQAAMFLDNARLYAELQGRVDFANAELREANQQLASEKARVETLLREMASGVLATDEAERIMLVNNSAERMLGIRQDRVRGQPVGAVVRDQRLQAMFAAPLSLSGGSLTEELEVPEGSGRVFRAHLAMFALGGETLGKILLLSDISDFIELDRMKTDLISFVSHELKNPLSALIGFVRLLQRTPQAAVEPLSTYTRYVDRQAVRMQHLVQDYLNLARLEAGRSLELSCEELAGVRELVEELVRAGLGPEQTREIRVEVPAELPAVWADREKLEQVLLNLLSNAVKYTPPEGPITVRAEPADGYVRFAVVDEGPGLSESAQEHLFEKFGRVREPGAARVPGTGIGLYLCKHLVEAHGGRIWVESRPGEGSAFLFTLPTSPPAGGGE